MKNNIRCAHSQILDINSSLLIPNPKNNNEHTKEQVERLAKIIAHQGQRSPIVISEQSGFIVKGHCRLMALQLLGWNEVAVDFQHYESEQKEYEDMTADNEIARWSSLNVEKFLEDIKGFNLEDIEMFGLDKIPELDFSKMDGLSNLTTPEEEWVGMPEFTQVDKTSHRYVIVHFENDQHVEDFFKLIQQNDTGNTKSIWFPPQERMDTEAKRYAEPES